MSVEQKQKIIKYELQARISIGKAVKAVANY